ncbi:MAG: L-threonylcarbamoyladenylate synthase [Acidimicrobiales bacterium]|jgi:L-threonylcarbamoyladenylate synthase
MPDPGRALERAASALIAGQVVAIPTDTVYGLAVDPELPRATEALFALKGRSHSLGLPVLVSGIEQAEGLCSGGLHEMARRVAERFWPGAVTLVVRRRDGIDWLLGGDATTIGIRCPDDPVARALCERVGPLATTSANVHGEASLTTAEEIRARFGDRVAFVIDGGRLVGPPSTVVDMTGKWLRCLREGTVPLAELEAVSR